MKYDVFIACKCNNLNGRGKTHDYKLAKTLHDRLIVNGIGAFLSKDDDLSKLNVKRDVDKAMEEATIMVVVGTCPEHMESESVKYEWGTFRKKILNKLKPSGKIITFLDNIAVQEAPIELRRWQNFSSSEILELTRFVKRYFDSIKGVE